MPPKKYSKVELAEMLARAMNLLMDLRSDCGHADHEWNSSLNNEFHELVGLLPSDVQAGYFLNATLDRRDFGISF